MVLWLHLPPTQPPSSVFTGEISPKSQIQKNKKIKEKKRK